MISEEIEFAAPKDLQTALDLVGAHEDVTILSGGMSLLPMMNVGLATPEMVVSLNHVRDIDYVRETDAALHIGALTRHATVADDPMIRTHCPILAEAAGHIGDVQVRNRGTLGGSVAHADPSADYLPVLALVGAEVTLSRAGGERTVSIAEFLVDMLVTAREPDEVVTQVTVPKLPPGTVGGYERFARVEGSFPIINVASRLESDGGPGAVAISGGVGPRPIVLDVSPLISDGLGAEAMQRVGDAAFEATEGAISDTSADSGYRREMARVFSRRALEAAAARLRGEA